jgi:serine/threonine-protein kinase HipA
MDRETLVYVDLDGVPKLMGRLWARVRKNKESATFEYDEGWLKHPARFSLEPALQLGPGPFHTPADTPMFGAIGDSAPDRWGRGLMRRMERRRAEREGTAPRTLQEIDFLLLVDDEARQGALRFAEQEGGPFLREEGVKRIPPLVELPKLLSAAEHIMEERDTEEDLRLLFAPGSSLGGARPKASVIEKDGHLAIAKFPRKDDEINTVVWEAVALALAKKAGIAVPENRVETISKKPVLLLRRFDREGKQRIPFLSAMSMLGSKDNEGRSYLEIVDALRQHGAAPKADMEALWRRLVFNILISNTDDHLRNHGFLRDAAGWRLSPAFDINPNPQREAFATTFAKDDTGSLTPLLDNAELFRLDTDAVASTLARLTSATDQWEKTALRRGLSSVATAQMAPAFDSAAREEARDFLGTQPSRSR